MSISEAIIKLKHDHYEPYIIDDGVWEEMSNTVEDYLSYIDEYFEKKENETINYTDTKNKKIV